MRINLRFKIGSYTLFSMLSKTQTLRGINSKVIGEEKQHMNYIFWDLENCTLEQAKETLQDVQYEFKLGMIFITSDIAKSYRAWCFSKRDFKTYIHILIHTKYVDWNFIHWTIERGYATIRTSNKHNRMPQDIVYVLYGYEKIVMPKKISGVTYDTGIEKMGRIIKIGSR